MSYLHRGDEGRHYSDNSHRWLAPPGIDQSLWEAGMRAHIQEHLATMGGPPTPNERPRHPARVPRRRNTGPHKLRKAVPPPADG